MATSLQPDIEALIEILAARAPRPLTIDDLMRLAQVERYDRKQVRAALEHEVAQARLRRIGKTRYQWRRPEPPRETTAGAPSVARPRSATGKRMPTVEGRYCRVMAGYGFVEVSGRDAARFPRDIAIPAGQEAGALHGDVVKVEVTGRDPRRRRALGRVVAVSQPAQEFVLGTLEYAHRHWQLVPENRLLPTMPLDMESPPAPEDDGLVARARIVRRGSAHRGPVVALEAVLGPADDPDVQFLVIAAEHNLTIDFPLPVREEVAALPADPKEEDFAAREDLRALPFMTIDGETARDFDDAVCLQVQADGSFRLWVAIADVAHYVRAHSALDDEAARRGTSVYFPDRAIPMLPPELSSELCSLRPLRPRLVQVCEMDISAAGKRVAARMYAAVILSRARLTYTRVNDWLNGEPPGPEVDDAVYRQLADMRGLMRLLYRKRIQAGSLDMDLPEALIDLSDEGRTIGVRTLQRNDAHRLIEEFMLEANRAVAEFLTQREVPVAYRVHEPPHPDSIAELNQFLGPFGFFVPEEDVIRPKDVQRTLRQMENHRLARVLTRQVLRALTKAHYTIHNAGHFGLAFRTYCHFTSPIRRYPDLMVHRQLAAVLAQAGRERDAGDQEAVAAECARSSQAERRAMEAERDMIDLKKAEFMKGHLGEHEAGTIVTVTELGFYVELDRYPIEGLVRLDSLHDDRYTLIEAERSLKGWHSHRRFRLGDRVVVECVDADTRRRTIDFVLIEHETTRDREARDRPDHRRRRAGLAGRGRPPQGGRKRR